MKQWVWFFIAVAVLAYVLKLYGVDRFYGGGPESRFDDRSQQKRAMAHEDSSYAQQTNHFVQDNSVGEALGVDTPWQVNQFKSRM
jgi:hypothetical protein